MQTQIKIKTVLVAVTPAPVSTVQADPPLRELKSLAKTRGLRVVGTAVQQRHVPDTRTYIGSGKLEQLCAQVESHEAELVVFDNDLSPKQGQRLERALGCMVWDRTQLILEIFARHARTAEARAQIELARLKYMLPRLAGLWGHLDREKGGIGVSRGMGEKQIAIDRRIIGKRIAGLEKKLARIAGGCRVRRKNRAGCFQVALVGYTNAGKSTLMNLLTGSDSAVADRLFATLDSTTRVLPGAAKPEILISDTVGVIRNLPHGLVASFRSTLDVVRQADLLLQVVDVGSAVREEHIRTTQGVLEEIGAQDVPRLLVFNKADLYTDDIGRLILEKKHPRSVMLSALDPGSRDLLVAGITDFFGHHFFTHTVRLPYSRCDGLAELYRHSIVGSVRYRDDAVYVDCTISHANKKRLGGLV